MLAHHPAHGRLDGGGLGKRPQLVAEPEQERLPRLGFAPCILGELALALSIRRNIDEDLPEADDCACLVAYRACGTVDPDLSLDPIFMDETALLAKDNAFSSENATKHRLPGGSSRGQRLEDGSTERSGMKAAENAGIGVIVEKDCLLSPLHGCGKAASQHHLDGRFQALRPG